MCPVQGGHPALDPLSSVRDDRVTRVGARAMPRLTHIRRDFMIDGPRWPVIEQFVTAPGAWLPEPAHELSEGHWRGEVRVGPLHRLVTMTVGPVRSIPDAWFRSLDWVPERRGRRTGPSPLPAWEGQVELREADGFLRLIIEGAYHPPGATVGAALDSALLHRIAEFTLTDVAKRIGARLEAMDGSRLR